MRVRPAHGGDLDAWAAMRTELWPDGSLCEHRAEAAAALADAGGDTVAFMAVAEDESLAGFLEGSLRHDYVNGCETSPVSFAEGLYVRPDHRRTSVGRALGEAFEAWARAKGCTEIASDALIDNAASHAFQQALGLEETERVVFFRKVLVLG